MLTDFFLLCYLVKNRARRKDKSQYSQFLNSVLMSLFVLKARYFNARWCKW